MPRLACCGVLAKSWKFTVHHAGGRIPCLEDTPTGTCAHPETLRGGPYQRGLTRAPIDYFKQSFYYDTAIRGNTFGSLCTHAFCGAGHMVSGTACPQDSQCGEGYTRQAVGAIRGVDVKGVEMTRYSRQTQDGSCGCRCRACSVANAISPTPARTPVHDPPPGS